MCIHVYTIWVYAYICFVTSCEYKAYYMHIIYFMYNIRAPLSQDVDIKVIGLVYKMLSAKQLKFAQLLRDALIAKV